MSENKVIELAKKLKELADRGVGGEKISAEAHLIKLLKKHNLTLDDVIGEKRDIRMFKISKEKQDFFFQVVASVGGRKATKHRKNGTSIWLSLTVTEYLEIDAKFDFYWKAYKKELDIFYSAFIQKNKLYQKPSDDDKKEGRKELSPEEKEKLIRMFEMMDGIKHYSLNKQIEQ